MATDVPLRDYVDAQVHALEKNILTRFSETDRAVALNAETLNERMRHSNGLIEQMREQARDYTRRQETAALVDRINRVEKASSERTGHGAGMQPLVNIGMLVLAAVVAVIVAKVSV